MNQDARTGRRAHRRGRPSLSLLAALLAVAAGCYHGAAPTGPREGALSATTRKSVREASQAALASLNDDGIGALYFRPDTGLVESDWTDLTPLESSVRDYPADERVARFRFVITLDSLGTTTKIYLEVLQPAVDPLGNRRRERMVPSDHPAMDLARRMMDRLKERLGS